MPALKAPGASPLLPASSAAQHNSSAASNSNSNTTGPPVILGERFQIHEELGRGATGAVFRCTDVTTQHLPGGPQQVAIKQISLAGMSQDTQQGVMGEINLLKNLNHPNIVRRIRISRCGVL
jgi:serine/threonine protein kinase